MVILPPNFPPNALVPKYINLFYTFFRKTQLAIFSMVIYLPIGIYDAPPGGIFDGWSMVTIWVAIFGAAGGVLVALVVKYTDSIIKVKGNMSWPFFMCLCCVVLGVYTDSIIKVKLAYVLALLYVCCVVCVWVFDSKYI